MPRMNSFDMSPHHYLADSGRREEHAGSRMACSSVAESARRRSWAGIRASTTPAWTGDRSHEVARRPMAPPVGRHGPVVGERGRVPPNGGLRRESNQGDADEDDGGAVEQIAEQERCRQERVDDPTTRGCSK